MERLTERSKTGTAFFDDDGALIRGAGGAFRQKKDMTANFIHQRFVALDKAIDRLAAYEDTGLEPEDVKEHEAAYIEIMTRTYGPFRQKISKWMQAEKEGRLVVLPDVNERDRKAFVDGLQDYFQEASFYDPSTGIFGMSEGEKELASALMNALTCEEAEAALKKREAENETD